MDTFTVVPGRGWILRLVGRNALVRSADRVEAFLIAIAVLLAMCAMPVAAAMGTAVYEARSTFYADQALHRHVVDATAVSDSETTVRPNSIEFDVDARWKFDDTYHVQRVQSEQPLAVNDEFEIWVDDGGAVVSAPKPPGQAGRDAVGAAVLGWFGAVLVLAGVCGVVHQRVNRARLADWDREFKALVDGRGQERRES